jgi:hypothetical protein
VIRIRYKEGKHGPQKRKIKKFSSFEELEDISGGSEDSSKAWNLSWKKSEKTKKNLAILYTKI